MMAEVRLQIIQRLPVAPSPQELANPSFPHSMEQILHELKRRQTISIEILTEAEKKIVGSSRA